MTTLHTQLTAEQPSEGPRNGGIARSATGKKGVKRRNDTKTFEVKYQAIMEVEKGLKSKAAIAKLFEIPATTLSTWFKSSESIKDAYLKYGPSRKILKTATYEDVEKATLKWFSCADIYNADETGVFNKLLPDKTFEFKNVACHGAKKSKERITALVCSNMSGNDKLPLLIIGKAALFQKQENTANSVH